PAGQSPSNGSGAPNVPAGRAAPSAAATGSVKTGQQSVPAKNPSAGAFSAAAEPAAGTGGATAAAVELVPEPGAAAATVDWTCAAAPAADSATARSASADVLVDDPPDRPSGITSAATAASDAAAT